MVMSIKKIGNKKYYFFGAMNKANANTFIKQTKDYDVLNNHKRLLRKVKVNSGMWKGQYAVYMTKYK